MARYVIRRLIWTIPTVILVLLASFTLLHMIPGDPARSVAGIEADGATVERVRHELKLDRPLPTQFAKYVENSATLNFGNSLHSRRPVRSDLATAILRSMQLAVGAMALAIVIGVPLGVLAAYRRGTKWDLIASGLAAMGVAAPGFWVGLMLIALFSVTLRWLPSGGTGGLSYLALPTITLSLLPLALIARVSRSAVLEILDEGYVRTARSKGVRERSVILVHVLRNASLPIITIIGLEFGSILSGATVVETVFAWPGMGFLLVESITRRDYPVVQAGVLVVSVFFILVNLLTDLAYGVADPRIKAGQR